MKKKVKLLLLSEPLIQKLEEFSKTEGMSQSEVVRLALFEFFKKWGEKYAGE
ncbi:MAG: hypothetical protein QW228_03085 [Candidatus Aenigmatarchaeota archaeon]